MLSDSLCLPRLRFSLRHPFQNLLVERWNIIRLAAGNDFTTHSRRLLAGVLRHSFDDSVIPLLSEVTVDDGASRA